jgi:hypothetical protein
MIIKPTQLKKSRYSFKTTSGSETIKAVLVNDTTCRRANKIATPLDGAGLSILFKGITFK